MRTTRALPVLAALTLMNMASCGEDSETADPTPAATEEPAPTTEDVPPAEDSGVATEAPAPTTEAPVSDDEPTGALAIVEAQHAAAADGDSDKAAEFWAANAVFTYPEGLGIGELEVWSNAPYPTGDYDGDGTPSVADIVQTRIALTDAFNRTVEMDCTEISESVVECTDHLSDVFTRAAGVEDPGLAYRVTVDGDLIVQRDYSIEQAAGWPAVGTFDSAVEDEVRRYEQWIFDTHRELHPVMFQGSCCTGVIATTTDSVEEHTRLMPEYQETLEA